MTAVSNASPKALTTTPPGSKTGKTRQIRQQRRKRLKPLYDAVRNIESSLTDCRLKLSDYDNRLSDEALYADADRKDELKQLIEDQASVRSKLDTLEWQWLEASEALEKAD